MTYRQDRWAYPALRAWHRLNRFSEQHIDALVIQARRSKAPQWAVHQQDNGRWEALDEDVNPHIEFTFLVNHPEILQQARDCQ